MLRRPTPVTTRHLPGPRTRTVARVAGVVATAVALSSCAQGPLRSASPLEPAFLGYGSNATAGTGPAATDADPASRHPVGRSFRIAGTVTGLYPGKTLPLVLTVSNPLSGAITVKSITTTVSIASSTCVAANVTVTAFSGSLLVPSHKSAKATVKATMLHAAPNRCQGKFFSFHYAGMAT